MLSILFSVIAPVLIISLLGYAWARSGKAFDTSVVTGLVTTIGTPCLIVDVLLKVELSTAALGQMAVASALTHAGFFIAGWIAVKLARQSISTYLPGMMFGNTGNMGLPLCLFAFGQEGLALSIAYFVLNAVLLFTVGMQLAAGRGSLRDLVRTPLIWAVAVALVLKLTGTPMPKWIGNTVGLLGGLTIPLMLMALGVSLSQLRVAALGRGLYFALVRLLVGFAIGWAVSIAMGLEGTARGVVVVQSAMPVAVFNYLFAARYNNRPEEVAGVVVLSTVIGFAILPAVLWSVMA